jgi:23S rRNA (guanosine2251-2'-O)-methyltransferase
MPNDAARAQNREGVLIFGIHPVSEALRAGRVKVLTVAGPGSDRLRRLADVAVERGVTIRRVSREHLDRLVPGAVHQGVVAEVIPSPTARLADLTSAESGPPLIVVLDGVEDPHNVGAILRTVDAVGASGVVRQTRRAAPLAGAASKASAGAVQHVRVAEVVNVARAVEELKEAGVWTVGLDGSAETPYYDVDLTLPTALVVGAEGHGLRRLVRERCDLVAAIPMAGHVQSLNVSVAAAVVLYEAVRQRRSRGRP